MEADQHSSTEHKSDKMAANPFDISNINLDNKLIFAFIVVVILAVNIYLRTGLIVYQGVFEPDGFFYLSVIQETIANHLMVPAVSALSGFPYHNPIGESPGLIYVTVLPYLVLQFFGLSAYDVMRIMPMIFGILGAIAMYFLVKYLYNSKALGLLAMFFISISSGNIARTAGGVYRGDSFVGLFIIVSLIFLIKTLLENDQRKRYIYACLAALTVSFGAVVWNGGLIVNVIYMIGLLPIVAYAFVSADIKLSRNLIAATLALLLVDFLNTVFPYLGISNPIALEGWTFLIFFIPILLAVFVVKFLLENKQKAPYSSITSSGTRRFMAVVLGGALSILIMYLLFGTLINSFIFNGSIVSSANIAKTTQELQPISYSFLFASFGYQLFIAPIAIILFLFLSHRFGHETKEDRLHHQVLLGSTASLVCVFLIIAIIFYVAGYGLQVLSAGYNLAVIPISIIFALLFARYLGNGDFRKMRLTMSMTPAFLVIIGYLLVTGYLQYNAIRYNALFSVPIALMAAYGVYSAGRVLAEYSIKGINLKYVFAGFIFVIILFDLNISLIQSFSSVQADGVNPEFLGAMSWLSNNTAANATVLALWPDGSVVEGWGDRQSFMDSVGGENGTRIVNFANWLFNTSTDSQYLYSVYKPQYLVARTFWFQEMGGIATEGTIGNLTGFGLDSMSSIQITQNGTSQVYQFDSSDYETEMIITPTSNNTRSVQGYVGIAGQQELSPIKQVLFYNTSNDGYDIVRSLDNDTANFTLMISFTGSNITQASVLGPYLAESNIFKMLILCDGPSYCPLNDNAQGVEFIPVYKNSDTIIYHLIYPANGTTIISNVTNVTQ